MVSPPDPCYYSQISVACNLPVDWPREVILVSNCRSAFTLSNGDSCNTLRGFPGSYKTAQFGHLDGPRKKSKTGSYQTAQELAMEMGEERKARLEKMVATTQLRLALEAGRKKSKKWIEFDLDLVWIEIGVLKIQ